MPANRSEIDKLMDQSRVLRDGTRAKIELLHQAIQLADSCRDLGLQYRTRLRMLETATFSGFEEQAISAFSFCLAKTDEHPNRFPIESLLWKFKYILESVADFPMISAGQIEDMFKEMSRRYRENGYSQRPVYVIKARAYARMGRLPEAGEYVTQYTRHRRDRYADCTTCELDLEVDANLWAGDCEKALQLAKPISSGKKSCAEVPHMTFANLLYAALVLKRDDEARDFHSKGYRYVAQNRCFLGYVAKHMFYLVHIGELPQAVSLFELHLPWALDTQELLKRLEFFIAAIALLERLDGDVHVRLPGNFPAEIAHSSAVPQDLVAWFREQAGELIQMFDERNGNNYYQNRMANRHELVYR